MSTAPCLSSGHSFIEDDQRITALYIHVPFCVSACFYCDFVREVCHPSNPIVASYVQRVLHEINRLHRLQAFTDITTAYIGGGTPTFLGEKLISIVRALVEACPALTSLTCEANPESAHISLLSQLKEAGVTRLSLGVQSFCDAELNGVGRAHNAHQARTAIKSAQSLGFEVSIDLIAGLPQQTAQSLGTSIETAIALGVNHLSCYALTVEEHTPLKQLIAKGRLKIPDEDEVADLLEMADSQLSAAGYLRYETSNYARKVHRLALNRTKRSQQHVCYQTLQSLSDTPCSAFDGNHFYSDSSSLCSSGQSNAHITRDTYRTERQWSKGCDTLDRTRGCYRAPHHVWSATRCSADVNELTQGQEISSLSSWLANEQCVWSTNPSSINLSAYHISEHNMTYWHTGSYIGLGPGAVSRLYRKDFDRLMHTQTEPMKTASEPWSLCYLENKPQITAWLQAERPYQLQDIQTMEERILDYLILALRTSTGISRCRLNEMVHLWSIAKHAPHERFALINRIETLVNQKLVALTQTHVVPTHRGWLMGNRIGVEIIGLHDKA